MDRDILIAIRRILTSHRVLSLAVVVEGTPDASLLPYAVRPDLGAVYIQASGLARHARGLVDGAAVGVLVHESDAGDIDALQIPRLTVQATVTMLDKESAAFAAAQQVFVGRFPAAEMTLGLGDFNLYELAFARGRYIAGFGQAYNVGPDTFADAARVG